MIYMNLFVHYASHSKVLILSMKQIFLCTTWQPKVSEETQGSMNQQIFGKLEVTTELCLIGYQFDEQNSNVACFFANVAALSVQFY